MAEPHSWPERGRVIDGPAIRGLDATSGAWPSVAGATERAVRRVPELGAGFNPLTSDQDLEQGTGSRMPKT